MEDRLEGVHWIGKKKDIERWIEMCPSCEVTKPNNLVAPLKAIVSQRKRQRIQIDFFDVGKRNKDPIQKHRYVLTIIDCFTKRAWLRPFQTKSGDKVAGMVWKIFRNDRPSKIQTDNGGEFVNKALDAIGEELGGKNDSPSTIPTME